MKPIRLQVRCPFTNNPVTVFVYGSAPNLVFNGCEEHFRACNECRECGEKAVREVLSRQEDLQEP
jgi:hypothetical protein